uniref:Single domain-containing protein n=1 Tax=Glossina morsitans morsitans TaxID=37546 RepID=A0A1B0FK78_GLOMM
MCSARVYYAFFIANFIFILYNLSSTEAAIYTQRAIFHPEHPGKCFDIITRRAMLPNKEYRPKGICAVLSCDLATQSINIETCPYIEMPGCEEMPVDPKWSYPKCCPQFKCTDFKTGKDFIVTV